MVDRQRGQLTERADGRVDSSNAVAEFFISFFARLVASSTPRSMVASPTTIKAASLSSSISPTSLRSELDIPPGGGR